MTTDKKKVFVGLTGASGTIYGLRLIDILFQAGFEVHTAITKGGLLNAEREFEKKYSTISDFFETHCPVGIKYYDENDIAAAPASGSFRMDYYIFAPSSMGFVGRVASGISANLPERVADVAIKENRPMVLLFRETPLSSIHLENLLKLSRAGVLIIPAAPAFYNKPQNIDDMVDFVVGKTLDILNIDNKLFLRWK